MEHRNCAAYQRASELTWFAVDPAPSWSARCFRVSFIVTQSDSPLMQTQRPMMRRSLHLGITLARKETEELAAVCGIPNGQAHVTDARLSVDPD